MTRIVDVRPGQRFAFSFLVTLGTVTVRMAFRWCDRSNLWYVVVSTPAGVARTPALAVRPGADLPTPPDIPGSLRWEGRDGYARGDLGVTLRLLWTPA